MNQPTFEFFIPKHFSKRAKDARLSPRETEIVRLLLENEKRESIANALNISRHTVDNHFRRIFAKLGIHDRATAIIFFLKSSQT